MHMTQEQMQKVADAFQIGMVTDFEQEDSEQFFVTTAHGSFGFLALTYEKWQKSANTSETLLKEAFADDGVQVQPYKQSAFGFANPYIALFDRHWACIRM